MSTTTTPPAKINDRPPNFRKAGLLYLVRCFVCPDGGERGRENWAPSVATGTCAWCGWTDEQNISPEAPKLPNRCRRST